MSKTKTINEFVDACSNLVGEGLMKEAIEQLKSDDLAAFEELREWFMGEEE